MDPFQDLKMVVEPTPLTKIGVKMQGGPLAVINGVITPVNGLING